MDAQTKKKKLYGRTTQTLKAVKEINDGQC